MEEIDLVDEMTGKAAGGHARADALSPEARSNIAKKAAKARWEFAGPQATHEGVLAFGDVEIPAYVLENKERILSTRGIMRALGRRWRGRKYTGTQLPVFLEAKNLEPFINNELAAVLTPVEFRTPRGAKAEGFRAEVLPAVCDVYLRARETPNVLTPAQLTVAQKCEMLVRALSRVGIIALVDEATGYQDVRDRLALQAILDAYLRKELAAWAKRFPDEFYKELFRLKNWEWSDVSVARPGVVGHYTNDLVYNRLAPGILAELQERNPPDDKGRRRSRHHQWLTPDIGHPALSQHLHALIAFMRISQTWEQFNELADRAFPKKNSTMLLPFSELGALDDPTAQQQPA